MNHRLRFVMSCVLATALAAPVAAQDALSKRVSLDLKAMTPADAFAALASSAGLKVVVDPAVTAPVDIVVRNVTSRTALTTMCESIGCEWTVAAGTLSIKPGRRPEYSGTATVAVGDQRSAEVNRILELFKKPLPAGMKFENVPLAKVSEGLSQALGIRVVLSSDDPALQSVTIDFSQMTLEAGLKRLSEFSNWQGRLEAKVGLATPSGKEPTFLIRIAIGKPGQAKK